MSDKLFKIIPDYYTLEIILKNFSIDKIYHNLYIDLYNINKDEVVSGFIKNKQLLEKKYRKYNLDKIYQNINFNKCITILRHLLLVHDFKLVKDKNIYKFQDLNLLRQKQRVYVNFD